AAILIGIIITQPQLIRPAPSSIADNGRRAAPALLVTQIAPTSGVNAPVAAIFDPVSGALRIAPATLVDPRHSAELWVIAADGVPHSLGVLAPGKPASVVIRGPNRPRFVAGSVLAVTIEPLGGSPDGKPTGAVVAKGALSVV
ncbi:MAG: anti-sigma factor, partial [Sphingomonas sp.]|nr:anti-sigma factor [Sphingomonas sp.]